jgi:AP2-like factor, ANT lineage
MVVHPFPSLPAGSQEAAARAYDLAALEFRGPCAVTNFDISRYLQLQPPVPRRAQPPKPALLQLKDEPVGDALLSGAEPTTPPLLQTKPEPEEALPLGPALLDADDVDHAIAEILPALCMDPADFEARYPARARTGGCLQQQSDDLRGLLPLPDKSVMRFEDDIEALFDTAPGDEASRAAEDAISSLASGRWL